MKVKRSKNKICFSIILSFLVNLLCFGQTFVNHEDYFKRTLYKTKAPEAWAFSDYSKEGSIDISTGKFDLTVPFTTIENDFLSLPVQLSYSTGGVKLGDNASEVGMGWNLIAGGSVTRTLNGTPDDIKVTYLEGIGGWYGMYNLYTGKIAPPTADQYSFLRKLNSFVTTYFRGSATRGYQDYYSNNFPIPLHDEGIDPNDYLISSILHMQHMELNVENKRDVFHVVAGDLNFSFILKLKDQYIPQTDLGGSGIEFELSVGNLMFEAVPLDDKDIKIEILYGGIDDYWYSWSSETLPSERSKNQDHSGIKGFVVTNKIGVKYYFENYTFTEPEYVKTLYDHSSGATNNYRTIQYVLQDVQINNWELTKVILPNSKEIQFDYINHTITEEKLVPRQHDGEYTAHPYNLRPQKTPYAIDKVELRREKLYLEKIRTENLTVQFNYSEGFRSDLKNAKSLNSMQLFDHNNLLIKEFDLIQQYYGPSTSNNYESTRLFLNKIVEKSVVSRSPIDYNSAQDIEYSFDYYSPGSLPGKNAIGYEDLYGYYLGNAIENAYPPFPKLYINPNLEGNKISYYPLNSEYNITFNGAERRPNVNCVHFGTLKSVTFPTKGSLEITYEANKFYNAYASESNPNGPGCRVKELRYYDETHNLAKMKRYGYTDFDNADLSSGVLMHKPSFAYISNYVIDNAQDLSVEQTQTYEATDLGYEIFLKYTKSKEQLNYEGVTNTSTILKKLITTSTHPLGPQSDFFGREILYTNVTEEEVSNIVSNTVFEISDGQYPANGKTRYHNYYTDNRPEVNVVSGPTDDFTYVSPGSQNVFYMSQGADGTGGPWCCDAFYTADIQGHIKIKYGHVEKKGKDIYPFPARNYFGNNDALKIGKTYKIEHFDNNNNKIQEKIYTYSLLNNSSYKTLNFDTGYLDTFYYSSTVGPGQRIEVYNDGGKPMLQGRAGLYFYAIDSLYTNQKLILEKEEVINYSTNGNITTSTEYEYNDKFLTSKAKSTNSLGILTESRLFYPFNLSDDNPQPNVVQMQEANRIAEVMKQESYINGAMTSSTLKKFKDLGVLLLLDKIYTKKGSGYIGTNNDDIYSSYDEYDDKGNILQYTLKNGTPISIIWGYKQQYPIAQIENCLYSSIPASTIANLQSLSNADDDTCFTGNCGEQALRDALNTLRSSLPSAMVTTYTYDPLLGLTSVTDLKGLIITYEYDSFGRLKQVRDADGNVLSKNEYHYKQ